MDHLMEGTRTMPQYLTVAEACELARISRSTFYKLLADPSSGLGQVVMRIPGLTRARVPERQFRRWLESLPVARSPLARGRTILATAQSSAKPS